MYREPNAAPASRRPPSGAPGGASDDQPGRFCPPIFRQRRRPLWSTAAELAQLLQSTEQPTRTGRPLPGGGQRASGAGPADGGAQRLPGSGSPVRGLPFDHAPPPGGYAWWYLDGHSADGQHALTVIAFVGSVFSPHYAAARRRQPAAEPLAHCGVNVALYGPSGRWSFTEYGAAHLARSRNTLCLGASHWTWDDAGALCIELDERTSPWPGQICGRLRLRPRGPAPTPHTLDLDGAHHWWPVAPCADLEVRLSDPAVHFDGPGYHDANWGSAPLEADFSHWDWQRACHLDATTVHYTTALRLFPIANR